MAGETKRCPDCAEQVLAAARKCRYCGYRFDQRSGRSWVERNLLRGASTGEVELPTLLDEWDVTLEPGEEPRFFRFVELDGRAGYLLVSDRRLLFLVAHGRADPKPAAERRLSEIATASTHGRRQLVIGGRGWEHRVRVEARGQLEVLAALLRGEGASGG
jgi:Uncharacterised protein family UPF0547